MGLVMKNIERMEPEKTDKMVGMSQREPGFYIVDDRTGENTFHGDSKINQPFSCPPSSHQGFARMASACCSVMSASFSRSVFL